MPHFVDDIMTAFYSYGNEHFSMLGLGDIVMPGLLLCFVLRYDNYKKQKAEGESYVPLSPGNLIYRVRYFHCTLIGYFIGESSFRSTVALSYRHVLCPTILHLFWLISLSLSVLRLFW